jgi:hypothetical protein
MAPAAVASPHFATGANSPPVAVKDSGSPAQGRHAALSR